MSRAAQAQTQALHADAIQRADALLLPVRKLIAAATSRGAEVGRGWDDGMGMGLGMGHGSLWTL